MEVTKTVQKTLSGVLGYKSIEGLGVLGVYGVWGIGMWWFGSVGYERFNFSMVDFSANFNTGRIFYQKLKG